METLTLFKSFDRLDEKNCSGVEIVLIEGDVLKIRTYSIYPQGTEWLFYMEPTMKYNAESNWKENNYGKELWELLIMELIRGEHYYKRLEVKNP